MIINLNNKNKLNICIVVFAILSLLITSYIFYNSCQKIDDSKERSDKVVKKIQPLVDLEKIDEDDFKKYIRKGAHIIEFAMLGISIGCLFVCIYGKTKRIYVSLPILLVLSVGVADEFIQSFVDRTSCLKDVLIDFSGACGGLLLVVVAISICSFIRRRRVKC